MKLKKPTPPAAKPAKPREDFEPDARSADDRDGNEAHARAEKSGRPKAKRTGEPGARTAR